MHKLLRRQLKKTGATVDKKFLDLVNQAYKDADEDRYHALVYELRNHYFFYAYNENFIITDLSDSIYNIIGFSKEEILHKNFINLITNNKLNETIDDKVNKMIAGEPVEPHIINMYHKDGSNLYLELSSYPVFDDNGEFIEVKGIARNITKEYETQKKLQYISNHDTLTGISNRHSLYNKLEYIISDASRNNKAFALMYIDLDNFKGVNDTLGHDGGDTLLKELTQRIKAHIRQNDLFARIGGDEFVVILTDIEDSFISEITLNIINALKVDFLINNQKTAITVSIGIASYPKDGEDIDMLLKNADNAMYKIKNNGKNSFAHFNSDLKLQIH